MGEGEYSRLRAAWLKIRVSCRLGPSSGIHRTFCSIQDQAAARFVALQAKIIAEIDRALAARAAALEQVTRQSRLTQSARDQSAAVEAMFLAGAADTLELSSAQLEASASELAALDAQVKAQQAVAQLEDAIQRPLESWPPLEHGRAARVGSH